MRRLSATDAARKFSDLLDGVERTGETVVIERRGRAIASISPAAPVNGRSLKELLKTHRADPAWAGELAELRGTLIAEQRPWNG